MIGYLIQRLLTVAGILVVMSLLVFGITQVMPGSVAHMILGEFATNDQIAALEQALGLNDPWHVQYWRWASGFLVGDFGQSLTMQRPIAPLILDALGRSAALAGLSFGFVAVIGLWLGILGAVKAGRFTDHALAIGQYFFIAVPEFFWCIVLIMLFATTLGWLPATGYAPMSEGFWRWLSHMILPVGTLVTGLIAHVSRLTRSAMLEVLQSTYVSAARAKGLPERTVLWRHALPNALLPAITVLAVDVGILFGGIVVVEVVFAYPGLGRMIVYAIENKDLPLMQAGVLIVTAIYTMANLVADLLYAWANPRIRYGRSVA